MLKERKRELVTELSSICSDSNLIILIHYQGMNVSEIEEVRFGLAKSNVLFKIVKNSLFSIALVKNNFQVNSNSLLFGPIAIVCSKDDVSAASLLMKFVEGCDKIKVIGGIKNGKEIDVQYIEYLASLKSIDYYFSKILMLYRWPSYSFTATVKAPLVKIITLLKLYADKCNNK